MKSYLSETVVIVDPGSGARAEVRPGSGFNCTRFQPVLNGRPVDVIWTPEAFCAETWKPYHGGVPILFPFAGRIRDARFSFQGRTFRLPEEDGMGNALHGLVCGRPWTVVEQSASRITGRFDGSKLDPRLRTMWPADFELTVSYEIHENELRCLFSFRNVDPTFHLPCSFGLHPYFRIPVAKADRGFAVVKVPASSCWEVDSRLLPSGRRVPAVRELALKDGIPFDLLELDHIFGDLVFENGRCTVGFRAPDNSCVVWMSFPELFQCCVVYTPPHREAICIEPYTAIPDPFSLQNNGEETGLMVLAQGEQCSGWVRMGVLSGANR